MTSATKTMMLDKFLETYNLCRVWWTSVGSPTGQELALVEGDDVADEDYCDGETLAGFVPGGTGHLDGTVTVDPDGDRRWEVDSLVGEDVTDFNGNTLFNLVVWGTPRWAIEATDETSGSGWSPDAAGNTDNLFDSHEEAEAGRQSLIAMCGDFTEDNTRVSEYPKD